MIFFLHFSQLNRNFFNKKMNYHLIQYLINEINDFQQLIELRLVSKDFNEIAQKIIHNQTKSRICYYRSGIYVNFVSNGRVVVHLETPVDQLKILNNIFYTKMNTSILVVQQKLRKGQTVATESRLWIIFCDCGQKAWKFLLPTLSKIYIVQTIDNDQIVFAVKEDKSHRFINRWLFFLLTSEALFYDEMVLCSNFLSVDQLNQLNNLSIKNDCLIQTESEVVIVDKVSSMMIQYYDHSPSKIIHLHRIVLEHQMKRIMNESVTQQQKNNNINFTQVQSSMWNFCNLLNI